MRKSSPIVIILILAHLAFVPESTCQEPGDTLWTRTYGGSGDDSGAFGRPTADGGYILVGQTKSFGAGDWDVYLVKTDSSGDTLWTRTYGGSGSDIGQSVQQTTDSGYIIAGFTRSFGAGGDDVYLIRTDPTGNTLWTRTYGDIGNDGVISVQQTADGGYIGTGWTTSFGSGGYDVYLIRTDSRGDSLWTRTYGGSQDDFSYSVQQTEDGGYVIAGQTDSFGAGDDDMYLLKTDASGDTLWSRTFSQGEWAYSVQQTTDGGYIVAGWTDYFLPDSSDAYLVKTDASGDTLWTHKYGGTGNDGSISVQQTTDGGYILTGWTTSYGTGGYDITLIKTDGDGDSLWARTYGGPGDDTSVSVQQLSDGGYILTGWTTSFGAGSFDFYLLRLAGEPLVLDIIPESAIVARGDTLCYPLICYNHTPDYLQLWFEVNVRLPNGQPFGPIFGPARFGMFGNGYSEGEMCHAVPPRAPLGDYMLIAEAYNNDFSAMDSMVVTVTPAGETARPWRPSASWRTIHARMGDENPFEGVR